MTEEQKLIDLKSKKSELEKQRQDFYDKERSSGIIVVDRESRESLSIQINQLTTQIMCQENTVLAGTSKVIQDKKEREYLVPSFLSTPSLAIAFDEDTILGEVPPIYIPFINEDTFRMKGYVFDVIRISPDEYILATNGYTEKVEPCYVLVTLDQLVLINDYYYTKAKATEKKKAADRTLLQEQYYDKLPLAKREAFLNQKGFYNSIPSVLKKKITKEIYEKLTFEEKEKLYKPFKRYGSKRLVSKLDENHMWLSFHRMYELFINPSAIQPKPGTANQEVFNYWTMFREMMAWKINDIKVQREIESENYKAAIETSFGESNTSDILYSEFGILVKRQNGDAINPAEIEQIQAGWNNVINIFGDLKKWSREIGLKISHTGIKNVFAMKAIGVYVPNMKTIATSNKYGPKTFNYVLAHESAHFIDNMLGGNSRYFTDNYEDIGGKIAIFLRKNMNKKSDSSYINATKECFARALEQHFAIQQDGDLAEVFESAVGGNIVTYYSADSYLNKEKYTEIKPLIEQFLLKIPKMDTKKTVGNIAQKHNVSQELITQQLAVGSKVETEHTEDMKIAEKIALDHLDESPYYYIELAKMEKKLSKQKYNEGDKVWMFPEEPSLTITKVYNWPDKNPTYDMKSEDGKIDRGNIPQEKIHEWHVLKGKVVQLKNAPEKTGVAGFKNEEGVYVKFSDGSDGMFDEKDLVLGGVKVSIGDEGMWHGGEVKVLGFDTIGNVEIVEMNNDGAIMLGTEKKTALDAFMKEFAKFPATQSNVLSNRAQAILDEAISIYNSSDEENKKTQILAVENNLKRNESGKLIGFDLDKDMVDAGTEFLKFVKPSTSTDIDLTDIAIKDVIENHPTRKYGNLDFSEAKLLYNLGNKKISFDEENLKGSIYSSLDDMGYIEYEGDFEYTITSLGKEFIVAVNSRISTLQNVSKGTDLFPEDVKLPVPSEKMYSDIKSCLLEEGDDDSMFIYEGKEILANGEKWAIDSFFKYGIILKHIVKNKLADKKENKRLTFNELIDMFKDGEIEITGIAGIITLNHCIKLLTKCIDIIDLKEEQVFVKEKLTKHETKAKIEQNYIDGANELRDIAAGIWDELGINSGSQLYSNIELQGKFKDAMDKKTTQFSFPLPMKIHDILEDENQHVLNQYLYLSGAFGEKEKTKWIEFLDKLKPESKKNFLSEELYVEPKLTLSKTEPIHIHIKAEGSLPEKYITLKYDQGSFVYDILEGNKKVSSMSETDVLNRIETGEYKVVDNIPVVEDTNEIAEAISMIEELLSSLKGKNKKEAQEAINMLKEMSIDSDFKEIGTKAFNKISAEVETERKVFTDAGLPIDTLHEIKAGKVTYRGGGFGKPYKLKVKGKEYPVDIEILNEVKKHSPNGKISFNAPFRNEDGKDIVISEKPIVVNGYEIKYSDFWKKFLVSHDEIGANIAEFKTLEEAKEYAKNG